MVISSTNIFLKLETNKEGRGGRDGRGNIILDPFSLSQRVTKKKKHFLFYPMKPKKSFFFSRD